MEHKGMRIGLALITMAANAMAGHSADTLKVNSFRITEPIVVKVPYVIDTVDNAGKKYSEKTVLDSPALPSMLEDAVQAAGLQAAGKDEVRTAGFRLENRSFSKGTFVLEGLETSKLFIDGKAVSDKSFSLEPGTHEVIVRYMDTPENTRPAVSVAVEKGDARIAEGGSRLFSLDINTIGESCSGVDVSPSGKLMTVSHSMKDSKGKSSGWTEIINVADSRTIFTTDKRVSWLSGSDELCYEKTAASGRSLVAFNPLTMAERTICAELPEHSYTLSPDESYLILNIETEGPKEGSVHQVVNPEDRQPGYRDRNSLAKYDIRTGMVQPLTFGYHNAYLADISRDGGKILFNTYKDEFGPRPTSKVSCYEMDMKTLAVTPVFENDGFVGSVRYSPAADKVVAMGSAEAFNRIGCTLPEDRYPNEYEYQLYIIDLASKDITPLTKDFDPSPQSWEWSRTDDRIYMVTEDGDKSSLYRIDPTTSKAEKVTSSEENVMRFSMADNAPVLVWYGESLSNFRRVYQIDTKKGKEKMVRDFNPSRLDGVRLGEGGSYSFTSSRGDEITAYYVLPPDFDSSRKYPMIVFYYGGCSPTTRYCIGAYSPQLYAAQGYVFLVVNPSGASGFGQEFASRHVNTAGEGVAEDIIECTEHFCTDNQFVDKSHIGCFSASYGGFMTQLLLTKTDMFATGISHAGISSHTSYWGEGYWGYSYSQTSMADSYPWNRKDLYVDRSPLYNADKIHTPLLFVHGSADTNVPIGESIQMFTALKLLGQDTAFVVVDGENHHILEFDKNRQWLRTMSAWFAKYLKEDSSWWDELYPAKNL